MTARRFFHRGSFTSGHQIVLEGGESHHVQTVLRGRLGDKLILLNGIGDIAEAEIIDLGNRKRSPVICKVTSVNHLENRKQDVCLYVALSKPKAMSQIIRQSVELGVSAIPLFVSERSDRKAEEKLIEKWLDTSIEACKQSINPYLPDIRPIVSFEDALKEAVFPAYLAALPETDRGRSTEEDFSNELGLWVGPEGGFTAAEIELLISSGAIPVSFSPWVLRVETAVISGLAYINERHK